MPVVVAPLILRVYTFCFLMLLVEQIGDLFARVKSVFGL